MKRHNKNSIWNRLKYSFILILMVPVLALGSYMVYSSIAFVKNERNMEAKQMMETNILDLNNRLEQCENSLIYAASNFTLQEFLQMDPEEYIKVNRASKNVGPLLYNVLLSNQYYKKLSVYAEKDFHVMSALIRNSAEVEEETWYQETLKTSDICWWYEEEKFFLSRKIATAYPKKTIGVICAEIKPELFKKSFNIFENIPVKIELNGSSLLYKSDDWKDGYLKKDLELKLTGWHLEYQISRRYFYPRTWMTILMPVCIIAVVVALAGLVIYFILKMVVKEVDYLVEQVGKVKAGNLDVTLHSVQTEELNILVGSINGMLGRIRQLIKKVYENELEQKKLELEVLQSKISPHFLYNNLSAINWIAIEKGQDSIYEITTQMAAFYRTALNKGKKADRLELEIANIRAYIKLQLISHEDSFDVAYEIDEGILSCVVPTFILQPLVENAIEHGIDLLRKKKGKLTVRAYRSNSCIYLEVEDNGEALYKEMGEGIFDSEKYGYGTGNVHRRIQLMMGEEYGLTIYTSKKGTISRLRLKADDINFLIVQ